MSDLLVEFAKITVIHLCAVASPGPDFAIVLKQSIVHGRKTAVWTSLGIGTGILLHVSYSLLGIGLLVKSSSVAFAVLKYTGAAYLAWIGVKALLSKAAMREDVTGVSLSVQAVPAARSAFGLGFLTNALNPKATLFFVAFFSVIISASTPLWVRAGYGVWVAVMTMAWFTLVSLAFTRPSIRRRFLKSGHWFDRAMGLLLIALAVKLALAGIE